VTKFAIHTTLKLIARGKLTSGERVELHRVVALRSGSGRLESHPCTPPSAAERDGNNVKGFIFLPETWLKPRKDFGRDCLTCAEHRDCLTCAEHRDCLTGAES